MCNTTFKFEHQKYTKIDTLYKRGEKNLIMIGDYSNPLFPYLLHNKWLAYEKVDGTNMSYYWDGHTLEIHGKTEDAKTPPHLIEKMLEILPIDVLKEKFPPKFDENGNEIPFLMIIYGEGYGRGIGKVGSKYHPNDVSFRVFDIKIGEWWLDWDNVVDICNKLNLDHVVPYGEMTLAEAEEMVMKGFKSTIAENKFFNAEGLVLRPIIQLYDKKMKRLLVKIKTCDYEKLARCQKK